MVWFDGQEGKEPVSVWVDADDADSAENCAFAHFDSEGVTEVGIMEGELDPRLNLNVI